MSNLILQSTTIHAPAERVFDLLADPNHFNQVNPDLTITDARPAALGGFDMCWEYRFGGMTLAGESTIVTFQRPSKLVIDTTGGVPSHWVWRLSTEPDGTRVDLELDYAVPKALAFMGKLLEKQNGKSVATQLANLKRLAETR
jgi:uncharacterized protein YndB with AHSA1/START domain